MLLDRFMELGCSLMTCQQIGENEIFVSFETDFNKWPLVHMSNLKACS